eukprot:304131-Rhodomonas_salina.6
MARDRGRDVFVKTRQKDGRNKNGNQTEHALKTNTSTALHPAAAQTSRSAARGDHTTQRLAGTVAVHGVADAGEGHGDKPIADVRQVQVQVHVAVNEPPAPAQSSGCRRR